MKKWLLLLVFIAFATSSNAQRHEPVNRLKDKVEWRGYTIYAIPSAQATGYGYEIWKGDKILKRQSRNPFNYSPKGLQSKSDALKVGKWYTAHLRQFESRSGDNYRLEGARLPLQIANRLQIQVN